MLNGSLSMSATQEWLKQKFREDAGLVAYSNIRLTEEIEDLKERLKKVETDIAYTQKIYFKDE